MVLDYDVVRDLYESLYGQVSLAPALFNRLVNSAWQFFCREIGYTPEISDDVYVAVTDIVRAMINGDFKREKIGDYSYERGDMPPTWRQIVEQMRRYQP